jgi:hypothetical protein
MCVCVYVCMCVCEYDLLMMPRATELANGGSLAEAAPLYKHVSAVFAETNRILSSI